LEVKHNKFNIRSFKEVKSSFVQVKIRHEIMLSTNQEFAYVKEIN